MSAIFYEFNFPILTYKKYEFIDVVLKIDYYFTSS